MRAFKTILLLLPLVITLAATPAFSQKSKKKKSSTKDKKDDIKVTKDSTWIKLKEHAAIGGSFWLDINSNAAIIEVMPTVGYRINKRAEVGFGPSYAYRNITRFFDETTGELAGYGREVNHIYGGRMYGQFVVYEPVFLRAELEYLSIKDYSISNTNELTAHRHFVPSTLVGIGYKRGERSYSYAALYYDLGANKYSYSFTSPFVIRIGYIF